MAQRNSWTPSRELLKGIVAGVVATRAMVAVRTALYAREDPALREQEERIRGDNQMSPLQTPVRAAARAAGVTLAKEREERIALALAWGLGIAGIATYAFLRHRFAAASAGHGLAFGFALWALEDEGLFPLLGFAHGPLAYPWQAHARGFAAHLAYGAVGDASLRALDRVV